MSRWNCRELSVAVVRFIRTALPVGILLTQAAAVNAFAAVAAHSNPPSETAARVPDLEWVLHVESSFEHPIKEVWAAFKDMKRWYTEYSFEVVSGPPYKLGTGLEPDQILKVTPANGFPRAGAPDAPKEPESFILKTLQVDPEKQIVVVLWGSAFDWKQYTSFYVWKLSERGSTTTVSIDSYGRAELVRPLTSSELADYRRDVKSNFDRSWAEAFTNLNKVMSSNH